MVAQEKKKEKEKHTHTHTVQSLIYSTKFIIGDYCVSITDC